MQGSGDLAVALAAGLTRRAALSKSLLLSGSVSSRGKGAGICVSVFQGSHNKLP